MKLIRTRSRLPSKLAKIQHYDTLSLGYPKLDPLDFEGLLGLNALGIFPSTL